MKKQLLQCDNLGMTKDTSIGYLGKDSNTGITQYAYNNYNIRITAINDNTQLSITNEKGPSITGTLDGTFLGSCKLNEVLVVFTHEQSTNTDRIYKITYNNLIKLYEGNLNFSLEHPIEAIGYYESSEVWKVYWVDGYNRNRFINIAATDEERTKWNDYSFDFQGQIGAIPDIKITKDYSKSGYFIAGVIQYFITYYNKLGVETPIVWSSDIQYISMQDRGAKPNEDVNCAFNFEISNVDSQYQYIRIYSVYRSSENDTADAKIVSEIKIEDNQSTLLYTDYGYQGQSINTQDLFYIGGQDLRANTLDYKQDTLFLGDITISDLQFPENIKTVIESNKQLVEIPELNNTQIYDSNLLSWKYKLCKEIQNLESNDKQFQLQNSQSTVAGFKCGEVYRFAIQLQTATGEWTIPYWLGDKFCNLKPVYKEASEEGIKKINFLGYSDCQVYSADVNGQKYYFCYYADNDEDIFAWKTTDLIYPGLEKLYFLPDYTEDMTIYPSVAIRLFEETNVPEGAPSQIKFAYKVFNFTQYQSDTVKQDLGSYQETKTASSSVGISVYNYYNNSGLDLYEIKAIPEYVFASNGFRVPTITFEGTNNLTWQNGIQSLSGQYIAYRLLIADTNISNRRIVAQGVINPTMFNYNDRANNRPFSFNSWVFRPRNSKMLNRHFDALPVQTDKYAELQGIMSKKVPGFRNKINSGGSDQENAFVLLFAPNLSNASCRLGYSLIYYNTNNCTYSAQDRQKFYNDTHNKEIKRNTETGTEIVSASTYWNEIKNDSEQYSNGQFLTLQGSKAIAAIAADNNFFIGITDSTNITAPIYNITGATIVSQGLIQENSWSKIQLELLTKIGNDLKTLGKEMILSEAMLPTAKQYKAAWFVSNGSEIGAWIGLSIATAVAVVATIFTAGAASSALAAVAAGTASMSSAIALSVTSSIAALGAIAGGAGLGAFATEVEKLKGIDKELAYKSITCLTPNHTIAERRQCQDRVVSLLTNMFDSNIAEEAKKNFIMKNANFGSLGLDSNLYMLGGVLSTVSPTEEDKLDKRNQFYVDESIVTINSPELEDVNIQNLINNSDGLQLNLVGTIPINSVYGEYDMQTQGNGLANNAQVIQNEFLNSNQDIEGILNGNFYQDSIWPSSFSLEDGNIPIQASAIVQRYKVFMWNRDTSWSLWFNNAKIKDVFGGYITEAPAQPKRKLFANYKYSSYTHYNDSQLLEIDSPKVFSDNQTTIMPFNYNGYQKYYQGNVDTIVTTDTNYTLINDQDQEFHKNNEGVVDINLKDPVSIKFKSTPHAVIPLKWKTGQQSTILPYLSSETILLPSRLYSELSNSINDYSILGIPKMIQDLAIPMKPKMIPDSTIPGVPVINNKKTWYQKQLSWTEDSPYLFMGEIIKKDFDYDNWNGGISEYALQQLTWNICSSSTDLTKDIFNTWGDTYYQRWECLKTYPFTEEDKNSVVDILSFMVESHINVDGRCDINKGTSNILNARPTNFNIQNQVYSQKDNIFSYQIVEGNVKNKKHFENEVVWSLTKNPLDSVDNWTNLNAANSIYLNGEYGPIRKILSSENSLIAFQDSSISTIDYNEKTALATSAGVPLQLSNTGKVTGYTKVSDKIGCLNKFSINSNSAGIFFVDDYNKTFNVFSRGNGIQCLSQMKNFSKWFKDNILVQLWTPQYSAFRASYDELTHDLYLSDNSKCLVYNTYLNQFTSFMDYQSSPVITNLHGKSVILHSTNDNNNVLVGNMFEGDYNVFFGEYKGYSLEYRIDSPTNEDTLFTNYNFIADWVNPNTISDDYNQFNSVDRFKTFDRVQAWNEYQFGEMKIPTNRVGRYKIKTKFREWYGDIPRDGYTLQSTSIHSDRLRNPWIHLKFIKDNDNQIKDTSKMTFYKLLITYYN